MSVPQAYEYGIGESRSPIDGTNIITLWLDSGQ